MATRTLLTEHEIAFVNRQRVAHLATADAAGSPSLIPVCYAYDGTYFYTPLDEKPKSIAATQLRRVRNILVRPEVVLLIDQYQDDWSQLGYIQILGQADILQPEHALHTHALALLRQRYPQYRTMQLERLPCIRITPSRIHSWGPALQTKNDITH
jgi:PPOX class probable F420-dependent enzyme, Rv0121 family